MDSEIQPFIQACDEWLREEGGAKLPRGTVAGALMVAELIAVESGVRAFEDLLSKDKGQIRKCGGPAIQKIISRFGDHDRLYLKVGGRTNRAQRPKAETFFRRLADAGLLNCPEEVRQRACHCVQEQIYEACVRPWYQKQRLSVELEHSLSTQGMIARILRAAAEAGLGGPVAQHLVGAKLCLRLPDQEISNFSYTASDESTGRPGDFLIGQTVFHVTMAPGEKVIEKCQENIRSGYLPMLLVPQEKAAGASVLVDNAGLTERIHTASIEDFVGANVSEIGEFRREGITHTVFELLNRYNQRVADVENDSSIQIDIPAAFRPDED